MATEKELLDELARLQKRLADFDRGEPPYGPGTDPQWLKVLPRPVQDIYRQSRSEAFYNSLIKRPSQSPTEKELLDELALLRPRVQAVELLDTIKHLSLVQAHPQPLPCTTLDNAPLAPIPRGSTQAPPPICISPRPPSVPPPIKKTRQADLIGVWDSLVGSPTSELTLDASGNFSSLASNGYGSWGRWSVDDHSGANSFLRLALAGHYPAKYYGPLWTSDIISPDTETWEIVSFDGDRVTFAGGAVLNRRCGIAQIMLSQKVSDVTFAFKLAEERNRTHAASFAAQRAAISSAQAAMQSYINSGVGRPRGGR